ncbi:hypothetical protein DO97_04085 [Neosynechococcus sphagnicola sy1]|uniref:Twin-arginine translocation pathway signal n=1 Tax=Neosynechococcus sphagnicola sy1 TaxID=1497020 RepID=A0A098TKS3_9CYAN|nr:DUF1501 domain-containing protein [Neosynechococcus sphagnicola]KGF72889.1 hypothetical protein DO97_04085 [Neosynechococcus sphagnicola sy1]
MNRRHFLQQAGLLTASSVFSIGLHGWALRTEAASRQRLVVIFLRGAVDGLNVVVPYQESTYYSARPNIAIPQPGKPEGALNLDGQFGLHPALNPLMPLWQNRSLAFVQACGSPDPTRSHFDAQDYMETGILGNKRASDGWMNRLLQVLPDHSPTQALNLGATMPRILTGKMPVANLPLGKGAINTLPLDRPQVSNAFDRLYSGSDPLSQAYQEGQRARKTLLTDLNSEMIMANNGAPLPDQGFNQDMRRLAHLMVSDASIQLAFLSLGGWDTHVNQGSNNGLLAGHLRALGSGLTTLAQGLGSVYRETVILVISEFGRTVHENGNRGTDHGHGNVLWAMGGRVQGGKVYGQWPGLATAQLYEGRDLAVTTDFRDPIASVLTQHLHLDRGKITQIFPGYTLAHPLELIG